ncbi:ABC transporter permease subunit [Enterovirga rhinocerotis]|uniref:Amino acid/amide ABC transporter membrane protein 2 (HAAT family) /amino acid/amide ABC transporter ATP-binding protein 1 (HAAT family) n=1 Tax=Enterovirga rhinocerotis TaxID=1339210 RepID=A0A4R7C5E8_9HYPH|nr:branched-chain amino acid ABC transporter ATP-binding protein/permease [Enterovirga rhinocerotis]TDR93283.1 amino acid/amide ABC transporter membrane protein 2 (HAAT family) /amino acid/amide ABC transporter ATP-binding protein 1 (HAAT family) [Enterovirga rhinocerotis]
MSRAVSIPALVALLAAIALPLVPGVPTYWITVASYIGFSGIVALGIVVLTGVAGVVSFGQAMFVGFGAYTTAILTTRYGWPAFATLPVAILITGTLAWGIGAITLRLKGHYLPVATIAWNISFFYLTGGLDFFRRFDGISGIPPIAIGDFTFTSGGASFYYLTLAIVALLVVLTANLLDSRVGRAIRALRGGVLAAESFGIDTGRARILAFVYAAVLASISGWLYAHFQRAINPSPFSINASIDYLLMAVAGGIGQIGGALLGSGIVTIVREKLQDVLPHLIGTQGNFEAIVFGFVLILIFQFAPEGLMPYLRRLGGRLSRAVSPERPVVAAPPPARLPPERGTEVLGVADLRKTFGGLVAVDDIGFTVRAGEIVGLIGPNGAGKSTTFNLVTGVMPASAGEVRFLGQPVQGWLSRRIARLGLARTFQHVKLVHGMSVIDNVVIGAHLDGHAGAIQGALRLDRAEEERLFARARAAIARVGLSEYEQTIATELALGQQRLVEIARALAADPVMILLDEPAAGLRHAEKTALADLLRDLRESGIAVLLVEHDMDFVMGLTDRLVVMNFGSELAQGRPAEIQRNPAVLEAYLGSAA